MITNDFIKGYLAALRTTENTLDGMITEFKKSGPTEETVPEILESLIVFIQGQRIAYKELVDKLNKENSDG